MRKQTVVGIPADILSGINLPAGNWSVPLKGGVSKRALLRFWWTSEVYVDISLEDNTGSVSEFTLTFRGPEEMEFRSINGKIVMGLCRLRASLQSHETVEVSYEAGPGENQILDDLNGCLGLTPEGKGWLAHEGFRRTGEYLAVETKPSWGNVALREQYPFVLEIHVIPSEGVTLPEFYGLTIVLYEEGGRPIRAAPLDEWGVAIFHELRISPMRCQARATPCPVAVPPTPEPPLAAHQ